MKMAIKSVTMDDRPSVFLGSSTEGLPVAEAVRRHLAPRANVDIWPDIFRPNHTYFETLLDLSSFYDFSGVEIITFTSAKSLGEATKPACDEILDIMQQHEANYEARFLPSTALALGYYHNFLDRLITAFLHGNVLRVVDKGRGRRIDYDRKAVHFTILLPRLLRDLDEVHLLDRIEQREISNFEKTLRSVLPDDLENVVVSILPLDQFTR